VIDTPAEMLPYESDGLMAYRQPPMVVVLPDTTEQVAKSPQILLRAGHQGGAAGLRHVAIGRFAAARGCGLVGARQVSSAIREIDFDNRVVVTEPGVHQSCHQPGGLPMPASIMRPIRPSQIACSIGGNVAENSGGVHCLKYGMTTNNVLGCEIVLISGEVLRIGGKTAECAGYDPDGNYHRLGRTTRRHHRDHGADPAKAGDGARL